MTPQRARRRGRRGRRHCRRAGLGGVHRVDDDRAAGVELLLGDLLGHEVGREPGRLVGVDPRAEDRRLDRVDRHDGGPEAGADDLADRRLARARKPGHHDELGDAQVTELTVDRLLPLHPELLRRVQRGDATTWTAFDCTDRKPSSAFAVIFSPSGQGDAHLAAGEDRRASARDRAGCRSRHRRCARRPCVASPDQTSWSAETTLTLRTAMLSRSPSGSRPASLRRRRCRRR